MKLSATYITCIRSMTYKINTTLSEQFKNIIEKSEKEIRYPNTQIHYR